MEQNTSTWLEWRKGGVGSSDAPAIMGVSPWMTARELWEQKTGRREPKGMNEAMRRGHELEPLARAKAIEELGFHVEPTLFTNDEYDWLRASMDGYNRDKRVGIEIKCPGKDDHGLALAGQVPEKYVPQIQHQYAVTGASAIFYVSYLPKHKEPFVMFIVKQDWDYIGRLIEAEKAFMEYVRTDTAPPLTDRDTMELNDDPMWSQRFHALRQAQAEFELAKTKLEMFKEEITRQMPHPKVECEGVRVTRVERRGSIDYTRVPEIKGVSAETLELYRKPSSFSHRFTFGSKDEGL